MSVINEEIYDFDYYVKKLPLYLQNSDGFIEHFRIWHDLLTTMVETEDEILNLVDVFNDNYLTVINTMDPTSNSSDILDKVGSIFNVKRKFSVTYQYNGSPQTKVMNLNNEDFLLLIKARIIKNYSDGSYQTLRDFYNKAKLAIVYEPTSSSAIVNVYLIEVESWGTYSEDVIDMFRAGLLTTESMGIIYNYTPSPIVVENLMRWDATVDAQGYYGWDRGEWAL